MYIWILLATVMVAFSFYNLSPRPDKEDAISRVKAASIITRFKLENNAVYNTLRCELLYGQDNGGWRGTVLPYSINSNNLNVGYTSFSDNLPIGYSHDNSLTIRHYLYVLDGTADKGASIKNPWLGLIGSSAQAYVVSFAKIPDRWISKSDKNTPTPIPAFLRQLGQSERRGAHYGWTQCTNATNDVDDTSVKCSFSGRAVVETDVQTDTEGNTQISNSSLPQNSVFWSNPTFETECSATPCLFAYHKFPTVDQDNYCKKLLENYGNSSH